MKLKEILEKITSEEVVRLKDIGGNVIWCDNLENFEYVESNEAFVDMNVNALSTDMEENGQLIIDIILDYDMSIFNEINDTTFSYKGKVYVIGHIEELDVKVVFRLENEIDKEFIYWYCGLLGNKEIMELIVEREAQE
jgi:hypothetical protein